MCKSFSKNNKNHSTFDKARDKFQLIRKPPTALNHTPETQDTVLPINWVANGLSFSEGILNIISMETCWVFHVNINRDMINKDMPWML